MLERAEPVWALRAALEGAGLPAWPGWRRGARRAPGPPAGRPGPGGPRSTPSRWRARWPRRRATRSPVGIRSMPWRSPVLERQGARPDPGERLPVPEDLQQLLGSRLAALPTDAVGPLLTVAAAARPTEHLVLSIADRKDHALAGLGEAESASVIRREGGSIRFILEVRRAVDEHQGADTADDQRHQPRQRVQPEREVEPQHRDPLDLLDRPVPGLHPRRPAQRPRGGGRRVRGPGPRTPCGPSSGPERARRRLRPGERRAAAARPAPSCRAGGRSVGVVSSRCEAQVRARVRGREKRPRDALKIWSRLYQPNSHTSSHTGPPARASPRLAELVPTAPTRLWTDEFGCG